MTMREAPQARGADDVDPDPASTAHPGMGAKQRTAYVTMASLLRWISGCAWRGAKRNHGFAEAIR